MKKIKVGLIQPSVEPYEVEKNLETLSSKLGRLKREGVQLAVLPEFFPTGNTLEPGLLKVAIETSDVVREWLIERSRALDIFIAGSYLSLEGDDVYNRFVIHQPDGTAAARFKTESPGVESIYYKLSQEEEYKVDTGLGRIGAIICIESFYEKVLMSDYTDCSLLIFVFAIPNRLCVTRRIVHRFTRVPEAMSKRNGIPVVACSMGGKLRSHRSPVFPFRLHGKYAGRSGIYLPSGPAVGLLPPGGDRTAVAEVPLGPGVASPDETVDVETGLPLYMRLFDAMIRSKAERIYSENIQRWRL